MRSCASPASAALAASAWCQIMSFATPSGGRGASMPARRTRRPSTRARVSPSTTVATRTLSSAGVSGAAANGQSRQRKRGQHRRARRAMRALRRQRLAHRAVGGETDGQQLAAETAASVERGDMCRLDQPVMLAVEAADDAAEVAIGLANLEQSIAAPPERVALRIERPRRIDPGMDEEQRAARIEGGVGDGGATQRAEKLIVAGYLVEPRTQGAGPAGDRARSLAAGRETLPGVAAIGGQGGSDPLVEHPLQDRARADRELQLQEFLPHLLLAAAQEGDVAGKPALLRHHRHAEAKNIVD